MSTFDYNNARALMVEQQIRPWDVLDLRVLDTLAHTPRELFVAEPHKRLAYSDTNLPLGNGHVMNKPVIQGRILQALLPQEGESVLEIASGTGYLSACLAQLCREVVSIEADPALAAQAQRNLQQAGITNVRIEVGDALQAVPNRQFDMVCVNAAVATIPMVLTQWLRPGGRMFIVHGHAPAMQAVLVHADADSKDSVNGLRIESLFETELPYLDGAAPTARFHL